MTTNLGVCIALYGCLYGYAPRNDFHMHGVGWIPGLDPWIVNWQVECLTLQYWWHMKTDHQRVIFRSAVQKYFRNLRLGPGLGAKYKVTKLPAAVLVHISHMWPRLRITCYAGYNAWGSLACGRDLRCLSECAVRCARAPAHGDGTLYICKNFHFSELNKLNNRWWIYHEKSI